MATSRAFALRSLLGRQIQSLRATNQQRRWAQVHDVRFLATTQASRSVAEKYREKLDRKAREEGLQDIEQLKAAYAHKIQEHRKKDVVSVPGLDALLADEEPPSPAPAQSQSQAQSQAQSSEPTSSPATSPPPSPKAPPSATTSSSSSSVGKPAIKPLSSILDLPKARTLPREELSAVWRLRHVAEPNALCAVVPFPTYGELEATARRHPNFVLPVPREGAGAEIHFLQWVFDPQTSTSTVLFTQLAEYKARGEWAQPHTSVTHYFDPGLAADQGVVLMAGSVVEGRGADVRDAQWLVMLMQRYYGAEALAGSGEKRRLLEEFGRGDGAFSVERLLEESEKLG